MCSIGHHPQSMYCGVELSEGVQISVNTCCHRTAPDTSLPGEDGDNDIPGGELHQMYCVFSAISLGLSAQCQTCEPCLTIYRQAFKQASST